MYGSLFDITKIFRSLIWALINSLNRSAVQGVSIFSRRIRASSLAENLASERLLVILNISPTSGLKNAWSLIFWRAWSGLPLRRAALTDSTSFNIGWMTIDLISRAMT